MPFLFNCNGNLKLDKANINKADTLANTFQKADKSLSDNPNDYHLPPLDSTIVVDNFKVLMSDNSIKPPLTLAKTKQLLYAYYKKKDFYFEGNIPKDYSESKEYNKKGEFKYDVKFDTAEFINLNNDNILDAIVLFELTPPFGSSHCYGYPNKAIIISKGSGFNLESIDFIPEFYIIDSIRQYSKNSIYIYGYDYDCPNWTINRSFRIMLKTENKK